MILELSQGAFGYPQNTVLQNISFTLSPGDFLCLLGPNGIGKTTLFKSLLGFLKMKSGTLTLDGKNVSQLSRSKLARILAYVPQAQSAPFPYTVLEVVLMGRMAYLSDFSSPGKDDYRIAHEALEKLGILWMKDDLYTEISGGERQMVLIARALSQKTPLLILDEPTSNLDYGNQVRVLHQIKKLSRQGLGVLMTSHFPNHAFLCASKVALLTPKRFLLGSADAMITQELMQEAYGVQVRINRNLEADGYELKSCIPLLR